MPALRRPALLALALCAPLACSPPAPPAPPPLVPLQTTVIKATTGLCLKGQICHKDRAGVWIPKTRAGIVAVSIAEQADVDLYADLELSTKPEMYQCNEEDAAGCVYRAKYSGPGLYDYGATGGTTYLGSNVTTTSLAFPAGTGIVIEAGVPVYVHLDVINGSMIDLKVDQDAWIYWVPVP